MEHGRQPGAPTGRAPDLGLLCGLLRSKKILRGGPLPRTREEALDGSGWCWCGRTEQILGPDRAVAHPEDCRPGRSCYLSPLDLARGGPAA
jgi:hypothetical protein